MIKRIKTYQDLPLEEGKTYATKMSTGEKFMLKKIIWREFKSGTDVTRKIIGLEGIWMDHPGARLCPIGLDRIIPDKVEIGEVEVCSYCNTLINSK